MVGLSLYKNLNPQIELGLTPNPTLPYPLPPLATDELRVYTNNPNTDRKNFTLVPSNEITKSGGWLALNASDGKVLWAVADPSNINNPISGPVSVANGVMFAASTSPKGPIYAIDAKSGEILWSYENGYVGVVDGVSISDGCIYVGQGLSLFTFYKGYNKTAATSLFAFCV
ncbi:hypothetical protein Ahy_B04g073302 [Arachis hypogaea]|uniref:Pyrrolo-quinoline quinone repeat domain-containing protein n=1 Tax=Arachis hypogaea TaxID=3818 RepID=A0A444ZQ82_ARAHY|nr:hypothetical protein Ahy_B04g073302 [Arachis hypogaea]